MASDNSDAIQVKPEELYEPEEGAFAGAPVSHVDEVEEVTPSDEQKDVLKKEEETHETPVDDKQPEPITHETDKVKTTYTTEEGAPNLSLKSKIMGKVEKMGDKLRPKGAVEAKNADPHPGLM